MTYVQYMQSGFHFAAGTDIDGFCCNQHGLTCCESSEIYSASFILEQFESVQLFQKLDLKYSKKIEFLKSFL